MNKELDEKLCAKYPLIFRDRNADPSKTCMYWGLAVGDGWYNIIDRLCEPTRLLAQVSRHPLTRLK